MLCSPIFSTNFVSPFSLRACSSPYLGWNGSVQYWASGELVLFYPHFASLLGFLCTKLIEI